MQKVLEFNTQDLSSTKATYDPKGAPGILELYFIIV